MKAISFSVLTMVSATPALAAEVEIPRSVSGDKGRYYLLESNNEGGIIKTLHKRIGVDSVGYTRCEINCKAMKIRDIGYSEEGPDKIMPDPTKWYDLVQGSSKSDMVNFVCKKK